MLTPTTNLECATFHVIFSWISLLGVAVVWLHGAFFVFDHVFRFFDDRLTFEHIWRKLQIYFRRLVGLQEFSIDYINRIMKMGKCILIGFQLQRWQALQNVVLLTFAPPPSPVA